MLAAPAPEARLRARLAIGFGRLSRFAFVGLAATLIYALLAIISAVWLPDLFSPAQASFLAYSVAAVCSYIGHKFFTFLSRGRHRFEAPRFVLLAGAGLAVSYLLPLVLSGQLGLPVVVPVVLTCVLIPAINYVVLQRWVFYGRVAEKGETQ